jgi:hypothetical protein
MTDEERIAQLEKEIADLKARLPRHSVPATMLLRLEELEDELKTLKARASTTQTDRQL